MADFDHRRYRRQAQMRNAPQDWHCGVKGCTRTAKQPSPAPECPLHPNVRMKPGKR